jgi:hypothetical protein
MNFSLRVLILALVFGFSVNPLHANPGSDIFSGEYIDGSFVSLTFVNSLVGWDLFFTSGYAGQGRIVANVEAGHVWQDHEVFIRPGESPAVSLFLTGDGALNEFDFHATMVAHVLAGSGYLTDVGNFTLAGIGMAPLAEIWSGAIATAYSTDILGGFSISDISILSTYQPFFEGIGGQRADVINSSWGGYDPAANSPVAVALDGMARENPDTALVISAGNSDSDPVGSPGSGFNGITVGSLGGSDFLTPSPFSSRGLVDFYNPVTDELLQGVRAGVHISAPGEFLFLAAYLGNSGGIGAWEDAANLGLPIDPSPTDLYFLNIDGTSFSSPMVAGGISLLRQVADDENSPFNLQGVDGATDSRVIRSVLMAGATETTGWDNGQILDGGVIRTSMAVDAVAGAGRLDLETTAEIYLLSGTRNLETVGGNITTSGWDFGSIGVGESVDYFFVDSFQEGSSLTVSLNWFAGRNFLGLPADETESFSSNDYFSNLNLQVWKIEEGNFFQLVAESVTVYNSTEFLRIELAEEANYGLRVTFLGLVFDTGDHSGVQESYGLAWNSAAPVPEPSSLMLLLLASVAIYLLRQRSRA